MSSKIQGMQTLDTRKRSRHHKRNQQLQKRTTAEKKKKARKRQGKKCVVGISYIYCASRKLNKVGTRYGVNVFTAADKLGKICAAVPRKNE